MERELWQDGTGNFLRIRGEGEENFADGIFTYQDIPGFLPMELTRINGQKEYVYDISGKISLAHYLSEKEISHEELKEILRQIMKLSDIVQEYLLEGNGVVCHEEYIYIDRRSGEVSGIYQENSPFGGIAAMGALLEFIMGKIDAKNEALSFLVYGLHERTKEAGMTRKLLRDYLENAEIKPLEENSVITDESREILPQSESRAKGNRGMLLYVLPITLLGGGLLLTIIAWCSSWFRRPLSQEFDLTLGFGASAFFLGVTWYGAWRTWPKKRRSEVIWQEEAQARNMCLISCQGNIRSIPIAYYPFVLGAEEKKVDGIVVGAGIEKIHAQILCEGNEIFVLDEESQQGTYHNDERLVPWQKKRLQDGDILRLAQTEYVVELG